MKKFVFTVELSDAGFEQLRNTLVAKRGEDPEDYGREHIVYDELFIELHSFLQENNGSGFMSCDQVMEDGSLEGCNSDRF